MNIKACSRGSVWRKWDLHFHTPSSYDYKDDSVKNSDIVNGLIAAGISAVAITDHHVIDVERIKELQHLAGDKLTVLPGIELRTQLGGSEAVHIIGIFSEHVNLSDLWQKLQVKLNLTKQDLAGVEDGQVCVTFEKAADVIHELDGIMSVHAGSKSNSFEEIKNTEQFKMYFKAEYMRTLIDLVEIGKDKDQDNYREIVFKKVGVDRPLVICSDNHNIRSYSTKAQLWIKGDATYFGLKQTQIEPHERVFIGAEPPQTQRVRENPTKYIDSLEIRKSVGSTLTEVWFDQAIQLNSGLVAIIGNKGSGKSALADVLGYLGDCSTYPHFSFLNERKFRDRKQVQPKASHFWAQVTWASGGQSKAKALNDPFDSNANESVKYIPQMYLERICMDYESGERTEFTSELKNAIFSHVPYEERLDMGNLDELLNLKTRETERELAQKRGELQDINLKLSTLEERASAGFRKRLEDKLAERQRALDAEDKLKPKEVSPPTTKPEELEAYSKLRSQIDNLDSQIKELDQKIDDTKKRQALASKYLAAISRVRQRLTNFQSEVESKLYPELEVELDGLNIEAKKLLIITADFSQLDSKTDELTIQIAKGKIELDKNEPDSLISRRASLAMQVEQHRATLNEPQQAFEKYMQEQKAHEQRRADIIGVADKQETFEYYKASIKALDKVPEQLEKLRDERLALVRKIYSIINSLADEYKVAYKGVQEFIDSHNIATKKGLQFSVALRDKSFAVGFMDFINANRKGSFQGKDCGTEVLSKLIAQSDLQTENGLIDFSNEVVRLLWLSEGRVADFSFVKNQVRQDKAISGLYDYLFGLDYLEANYTLTWNGKALEQLSPGERGTLLLIFYLLVDKNDVPLIIDQPEENLDNQTVFDTLVDSIREAKQRRQVIIVTHNPNLAVVCDADQVIYSKLEKDQSNRVSYTTGALENPTITQLVVDVLEGTRKAFDVRDAKYRLSERWKILQGHLPFNHTQDQKDRAK